MLRTSLSAAQRASPVAKARPSHAARRKATNRRTEPVDGVTLPMHSVRTLLADLAPLTRNVVCFAGRRLSVVAATPTPLQHRAPALLGADSAAA